MSRSLRTRPTTLYAQDPSALHGADAPAAPVDAGSGARAGGVPRPVKKPLPNEGEVAPAVRKRLSMRYGAGWSPGGVAGLAPVAGHAREEVPPVPSVPPVGGMPTGQPEAPSFADGAAPLVEEENTGMAIPLGQPAAPASYASVGPPAAAAGGASIPMSVFAKDSFDAPTFVSEQVQQRDEAALRELQRTLAQYKEATQKQLKAQVFKNYSEFITISKEIAVLENDMLELKELLLEWRQLPQLLQVDEASDVTGGLELGQGLSGLRTLGRTGRNSMVDLEQIYRTQINSLWENIEGSQKFVPYAYGRHLIAETSQFVELNAATYKPKQAIALFLLDDLLLVAVQRKRQYGSRVHLVAERCFSLSEIVVVDLKDGRDVSNALKIKRGKEVYVYRTERAQDKRALLNAFRRVGEDLANRRKRERQSVLAASRTPHAAQVDTPESSLDPDSSTALLVTAGSRAEREQDSDVQSLGPWLSGVTDELAVHIALREWDEAVALVQKGRRKLANRPVSEGPLYALHESFTTCTNELVDAICTELASPVQRKSTMVRDVGLLLRLDKGREARQLFLDARTELLRRRTRQIKYEGDVSLYISELAVLHFTLIKNTGDWYMSAFKEYKMASGTSSPAFAYADRQASCSGRQTRFARTQKRSADRCMVWTRTPSWCARRSRSP